jgi:CRP-like cAMP-binding protein
MSPLGNIPEFRNRILSRLKPDDLDLFRPDLEPIQLDLRQSLEIPNQSITHAYFPSDGLASIVAEDRKSRQSEIGIVGFEGMTAMSVLLENEQSPNNTYMQIAGAGHRLGVVPLRGAMAKSESLRRRLLRYVHAFTIQMSQTALANSKMRVDARLARWLLMAHDRVERNDIELTHEFLALMLGVRRAGVTEALQDLESRGLIRALRGKLTILRRKDLEIVANGSYGVPEAEYERLMAEPD